VKLLPLTQAHIPVVAQLHTDALAGDFLPSLGEKFLRVFYRAALRSGLAFGFVQVGVAEKPDGFVLASPDTSALFRRVAAGSALALGWAALPAVLRRPALLGKVGETFLYPAREAEAAGAASGCAELLVIAVAPARRSQGTGAALVAALNETFARQGISRYKVTVLAENDGANRFYCREGFQQVSRFIQYGKWWNLYLLTLPVELQRGPRSQAVEV
jgi:ribosomal protein S18 acetylase RimI-like enzyme